MYMTTGSNTYVEKLSVVRETKAYVFIEMPALFDENKYERKMPKESSYDKIHESLEGAQKYLLERAERRLEGATKEVALLEKDIATIKSWSE